MPRARAAFEQFCAPGRSLKPLERLGAACRARARAIGTILCAERQHRAAFKGGLYKGAFNGGFQKPLKSLKKGPLKGGFKKAFEGGFNRALKGGLKRGLKRGP